VHFVRLGRGAPPLVFVHGFACDHRDWQPQLDFFSKTHEVVACDLRGHGETPGQPQECSIEHYGGDVAALILNLDFSKCILIGHSMGTRVVLEAARLVPKRVAGLVMVDGSRGAPAGDPHAAEAGAKAAIGKVGYPTFAENLFRQMFFKPSAEADAIVARAVRSSAQFGPVLYPRMVRWDAQHMDAALAAVQVPMLVIQSTTRDANWNRAPLERGDTTPYLDLLKQKVKQVRIEIVPDTGHFTMLEAPAAVDRLIEGFVRRMAPG
jgi:pimeloyl-ACP methyl ester carboxylesterase